MWGLGLRKGERRVILKRVMQVRAYGGIRRRVPFLGVRVLGPYCGRL